MARHLAADIARAITPGILTHLEDNKRAIIAELPLHQRLTMPVMWPIFTALVPGLILSTVEAVADPRMWTEEFPP